VDPRQYQTWVPKNKKQSLILRCAARADSEIVRSPTYLHTKSAMGNVLRHPKITVHLHE